MKKSSVAAWVCAAIIAIFLAANKYGYSDRLIAWLGQTAAPAMTETGEPAEKASAPATDTSPAETAEASGDAESPAAASGEAAEPAAETEPEKAAAEAPAQEPAAEAAEAPAQEPAADAADKPAEAAAGTQEAAPPAAAAAEGGTQEVAKAQQIVIPTFDLVRVEPDGSTVIAGKAAAEAEIEVLSGSQVIAGATAETNGDFVAVLDKPLSPGDYELVLRSTEQNGDVAMSTQTAVVSVPTPGHEGELLALVEEPGQPSRLINTPAPEATEAAAPSEPAAPAAEETAEAPQAEEPAAPSGGEQPAPADEQTEVASAPAQDEAEAPAAAKSAAEAPATLIRIEAVEIDGDTVFVAGAAGAGAQVRVYANEILLGDTIASDGDRFLVEVKKDLPVGDYIIRADVIDPATAAVKARAAVPFTRSEGEHVAAVATDVRPAAPGATEAGTPASTEAAKATEVPDQPAEAAASADAPTPQAETAEAPAAAEPATTQEETAQAPQAEQPAQGTTQESAQASEAGTPSAAGAETAQAPAAAEPAMKQDETAAAAPAEKPAQETAGASDGGEPAMPGAGTAASGAAAAPEAATAPEAGSAEPAARKEAAAEPAKPEPASSGTADAGTAMPDAATAETAKAGTEPGTPAPAQPETPAAPSAGTETANVEVPEQPATLPAGPPLVSSDVTVEGELRPTDTSVIIRRGDTLWQISRRVYGKGVRYTTIYLANQDQIKDPDKIWPGQIFALPDNGED